MFGVSMFRVRKQDKRYLVEMPVHDLQGKKHWQIVKTTKSKTKAKRWAHNNIRCVKEEILKKNILSYLAIIREIRKNQLLI